MFMINIRSHPSFRSDDDGRLDHHKIFMVEPKFVGLLIGKAGDTIKEMKRKSGATIDIDQDVPEGTNCFITMILKNSFFEA